jgi:hypothetical protein
MVITGDYRVCDAVLNTNAMWYFYRFMVNVPHTPLGTTTWLSGDDTNKVTRSPGERATVPVVDAAKMDPTGITTDNVLAIPLTYNVAVHVLLANASLILKNNVTALHVCEIKIVFRNISVDELPIPM